MPSTFPTLFRGDVIRSTSTPPRRPDSGASSSKRRPSFPTAALIAPGFPNLLVAGRSFSADAVASASVRVQASVMGPGQAAGAAAAQCVRSGVGVAEIDVGQLRRTLVEYGANLTA